MLRVMHQRPRLRDLTVMLVSAALLAGCGAFQGDETTGASPSDPSESGSGSGSPSPSGDTPIPGDGTYRVGSEVQPGVYVGTGSEECQYQRLGKMDAGYDDVIVRGLLDRPVIEIMAGDGGFRTDGCGSWTPLESYSGTLSTEIPGDGLWLVGTDVEPGTYRAEGGEWCLWQRLEAFAPELDSVISGGSNKLVTIEEGDLGFVTEGCGAWSQVD